MADRLRDVVFHEKLGSLADKAVRLQGLVAGLGAGTPADGAPPRGNGSGMPREEVLRMAARLAKADLVSQVVIEFPVLQGVMGSLYAITGGFGEAVSRAVGEHYWPLSATAPLPGTLPGSLLAVADKADNIAGAWVAGQKPSGSRDPYGLRRAAMGIVRIALEYALRFPLAGLLASAWWASEIRNLWATLAGWLLLAVLGVGVARIRDARYLALGWLIGVVCTVVAVGMLAIRAVLAG